MPVTTPNQRQTESAAAAAGSPGNRRIERNRRRDTYLRRLLGLADVLALSVALTLSLLIFGEDRIQLAIIAAPALVVLIAKLVGLYDRDPHLIHKTTLEEVPAIFAISTLTVLTLFLSGDLFVDGNFEGRQGFGTLVILFVLMVSLRATARLIWRSTTPSERCLLVGDGSHEADLRDMIELSDAAHVELVGVAPGPDHDRASGPIEVPDEMLDELEVDRVIVASGQRPSDEVMFVIRELRDAGVKVSLIPDLSRLVGTSIELDPLGGLTLLGMRRFAITRSSHVIKRAVDLVISATLLILLAPVFAAIAIAIRLDGTGGGVLYRQHRIGRHGKAFEILKFRTMADGAHDDRERLALLDQGAEGLFKIPDDPRATRVGAWIRRTNLDELPQLINVLRGEMSLVGPRPLIPEEDEHVPSAYRRRLDVRPGITGHWQVLGSARVPLEEMVKLDYVYVANWSLWGDVVLLLRTIPLIARRRGM